ncbi:MAG: outer membrane beta-barrel protein, partial [Pseudomonadota bacterium]
MKQLANGIGCAVTLLAVLVSPMASVAQDSPEDRAFDRRWYLGAGAGATRLEPEPRSTSMSIGDKSSTSGSLFFGRDISKHYSVEGHLATLGEAGINFLGAPVGELDYTVAGISAIRYLGNTRGADGPNTFDDEGLYRREGLSFYARLGLGGMRNSSTNNILYETRNNVHVMGGVGAEYGFTNGFAVRLEATAYDTDARELSLRVLKRLGSSSAYAGSALAALPAVVPVPAATPTPVPAPTPAAPPLFSFDHVLFAFDKSEINPAYARELESLARILKDNP